MDIIAQLLQIIIGLGILNVWLLRSGRPTEFRGGEAKNLREEFQVYGLPGWCLGLIGVLKVTLALMLILGVWIPVLTLPAAIGMAILMLGAVLMHVKVRDPMKKALPAINLLVLCIVVATASSI